MRVAFLWPFFWLRCSTFKFARGLKILHLVQIAFSLKL